MSVRIAVWKKLPSWSPPPAASVRALVECALELLVEALRRSVGRQRPDRRALRAGVARLDGVSAFVKRSRNSS
jgi:hypothetical protein